MTRRDQHSLTGIVATVLLFGAVALAFALWAGPAKGQGYGAKASGGDQDGKEHEDVGRGSAGNEREGGAGPAETMVGQ